MGKIVAIGGGENGRSGTAYETGPFDREIVALTGKERPNFLFVGLANDDPEFYYQVMRAIYRDRFGCPTQDLTRGDLRSFPAARGKLQWADIIYVGGGNTLRLMHLLRNARLDGLLREAYERDCVLCGLSAGAICWCAFGNSDSLEKLCGPILRVRGLGFIPALFCPHYDGEKKRPGSMKHMMRYTRGVPGLALDNGAALEMVDGQYRILTSLPGARAQMCDWHKGEYRVKSLPENVWRPVESW